MDLLLSFERHILSHEIVKEGDRILLAISGGLDSTVMLHLFCGLREKLALELQIVHVDHGLRGASSVRDAEFVRRLGRQSGLPCIVKTVDAEEFGCAQKVSLEDAARTLRYSAFDHSLSETGFEKLATAHTRDDQVETVLDRFLRGTGIRGMGGILMRRGPFVRPLLKFSREELCRYADQNKVEFCEDHTNEDVRFKRNRIRHELIPFLKESFNPSVESTLNHLAAVSQETELFLNDYASKAFKSLVFLDKKNEIILDLDRYINYFDIVKKYILFHACEALGVNRNYLTFEKLAQIQSVIHKRKIGKRVFVNRECEVLVDHDGIVVRKRRREHFTSTINLGKDRSSAFETYEFCWSIMDRPAELTFDKNPRIEFIDLDTVGRKLLLRNAQAGDRFVPLNFKGRKKVADYFSDLKVPHHLRDAVPVLESSSGIVWICGFCIDDRFKVTKKTKRLLKLEMSDRSDAN